MLKTRRYDNNIFCKYRNDRTDNKTLLYLITALNRVSFQNVIKLGRLLQCILYDCVRYPLGLFEFTERVINRCRRVFSESQFRDIMYTSYGKIKKKPRQTFGRSPLFTVAYFTGEKITISYILEKKNNL